MGRERNGPEAPEIPKILERAKPLGRILQPTEDEEAAFETIQGASVDRTLSKQARARLAALTIVRQSFTDYVVSSGDFSTGPEFARVVAALKPNEEVPTPPELAKKLSIALHTEKGFEMLEEWMRANLKKAEVLETDLDRQGVTLDPMRPARSTVRTGLKGSPPTLLTETVKALLHERFPEWSAGDPFPEPNTQDLRDSLTSKLMALTGSRESGLQFRAMLFAVEDIDPRTRKPLYNILNHLRKS